MKTITLSEAFAKATKGKLTSHPFTVHDWDDDPIGVYAFESARQRLEGLYAAADVESPELDAVHAENRMNAALLAHCFNHFQDMASACERMMVGITGQSTPDCDWYEGIEHDAAGEAKAILAKANQVTLP